MINERSIYVVIPSHNEGEMLGSTIAKLLQGNYTVVVVDDGSQDDTWNILSTLPVVRIRHLINLGQGAALQTGMTYAQRDGARVIVHFDADGQHDPEEIPELVKPIEQGRADVVLGSRFLRGPDPSEIPWLRRILLKTGRLVSGAVTGVWLSDAHNGFRALSNMAAAAIQLHENGFAHATEILEQIRRAGLSYVEVPTRIKYTEYSLAKGQHPANALNIILDLLLRKIYR